MRSAKALSLKASRATPHRVIALLCAVALLAVSFAHSIDHFSAPAPIVAMHADWGFIDDSPDGSQQAPGAIEHCHGCAMNTMVALAPPILSVTVSTELPLRRPGSLR